MREEVKKVAKKVNVAKTVTRLSVTIGKEVVIENHKKILYFGNTMIKVSTDSGIIVIEGRDFNISFLGGNTVSVDGEFESVRCVNE